MSKKYKNHATEEFPASNSVKYSLFSIILSIIVKKIVQSFKLSPTEKTSAEFIVALSLRSKTGMPVGLETRD